MQPDLSPVDSTIAAFQATRADNEVELAAEQEESDKDFQADLQEEMPMAVLLHKNQKALKPGKAEEVREVVPTDKKADDEKVKEKASNFEKRNPELKASVLVVLRGRFKPDSSKEEILDTLKEFFADPSLQDEALDFLQETANGELAETIKEAKEEFGAANSREIAAGKNIAAQAREASASGKLGTPTELRQMYSNITGNPRDSGSLFDELSKKYPFQELKKVTNFLLHSLGADLKSKGPSIPQGQLHVLMGEVRSLQAILNVYRFFNTRMGLVNKLFKKEGLPVPQQLNFESLAKQFMGLVSDRYPSADKVLQSAVRLGIDKWIMAKIIAFSQLRDAIREMAVNQIYRSVQHRDELYMAILEALEDLEEELEELLDKEAEEDDEEEEEDDDDDDEDNDDRNNDTVENYAKA